MIQVKYNEEAFQLLSTFKYNIRDNFLQAFKFYYENYTPCVIFSCSNNNGEEVLFDVEFRDLILFDFYFEQLGPGYIEDYKLKILNNQYYLSLDPDDATEDISKNDCRVIISNEIRLMIY